MPYEVKELSDNVRIMHVDDKGHMDPTILIYCVTKTDLSKPAALNLAEHIVENLNANLNDDGTLNYIARWCNNAV